MVRGFDRTEIRLPCCPQFVHAICGSMKRRFISTPSIAPAKLAVCAVFRVLPSNFKRPYLFNRSADLGEFYVQSKGFPCSTWKSSDFGRMDEKKRGPFFLMWGFFRVKNTKVALARNIWYGASDSDRDSFAMLSSICRCYMWKHEAPFHFNPVYRPRKVGCLCRLSRFALQLQKAISFQPLGGFG